MNKRTQDPEQVELMRLAQGAAVARISLTAKGLPPALNGNRGLIRMHFRTLMSIKQAWLWVAKGWVSTTTLPYRACVGLCRISYTVYNSRWMDHDNYIAGFKVIGDALVDSGLLLDDSPKVVLEFKPHFVKVKHRAEHGIEINIDVLRWAPLPEEA